MKRAKPKQSNKIKRAGPRTTRTSGESPIARLKRLGTMDIHEHTAADEIITAYCMVSGLPISRDPDLGIPSLPRADAADEFAARQSDLVRIYPEWLRDLRGTDALQIAKAVLFEEVTMREIDATNRWRSGTASDHLMVAVRHFAALRGNVPRGARDWKYKRPLAA